MSTWMTTTSDWDDHRYALPSSTLPRRVRLFFFIVDSVCGALRRVRR